jgi:hypothetical protein
MKEKLFGIGSICFVFGIFFGISIGDYAAHKKAQREAVKVGVAQFVVDKNGDVKFEWINCSIDTAHIRMGNN